MEEKNKKEVFIKTEKTDNNILLLPSLHLKTAKIKAAYNASI
jgi:hypothetical protein